MKNTLRYISVLWVLVAAYPGQALQVSDFGAVPGDGDCDMEAIHKAIQAAIGSGASELIFDAGTYNLRSTVTIPDRGHDNYIGLFGVENLALIGQTDDEGRPATRLVRNLELNNETKADYQIEISDSRNVTVKNFVLTNDPTLGSTGRVISVDASKDEVVVEVLDGLPAYDGMRCASAHAWNLETGKLKRFGRTPSEGTLTIGLGITAFWEAVPGTDARQLKMAGAGFAEKVEVGDGISWHHKATDSSNQTRVMHSRDVVFENIVMPNVSNMGMLAGFNRNLTFRKVRFEPENGNLAVGGRDGLHLSMNSGELIIDECYFKGLRMDPLVIRRGFGLVKERRGRGTVVIEPGYVIPEGDQIRFWMEAGPIDRTVTRSQRMGGSAFEYDFAEDLPEAALENTPVTYLTHSLDRGIVSNSVFEDNFGSAIVNFEENITVEGCTFDNNSYQIKYGPNLKSGGFVRHNIVRDNMFENPSWIDIARRDQPSALVIHSLSQYFDDPRHNGKILVTGNVFRNEYKDSGAAALVVRNAEDVEIRDNVFEGFSKNVVIERETTRRIR